MALRLSKTLGRSPESWLMMQDSFNGMLIESEDLLIAATALANQMKLATGNVKHFNRIEGLELVVDDKFEKFI